MTALSYALLSGTFNNHGFSGTVFRMNRTSMMWGIATGFVVLLIVLVVSSALRPAPPIFSVRVIHFDPGDANALVEVTNLTKSLLSVEYTAPNFKGRSYSLHPHGAEGTAVPAPTDKGKAFKVTFWVREKSNSSWRVKYAAVLQRFGIRAGSRFSFEVAKPTGWMPQ
jgi:hypothetical protein